MTVRVMVLATVVLGTQVGCRRVSASDAQDALHGLQAIASVDDTATRERLMLASCGEIKSCAAGCEKALKAVAEGLDPSMTDTLFAVCYSEFKSERARTPTLRAMDWFRGHYGRFLDGARPLLAPADQQLLDDARARLGLRAAP